MGSASGWKSRRSGTSPFQDSNLELHGVKLSLVRFQTDIHVGQFFVYVIAGMNAYGSAEPFQILANALPVSVGAFGDRARPLERQTRSFQRVLSARGERPVWCAVGWRVSA